MKKSFFSKVINTLYYIMVPALSYAIWYLINYFVTTVSSYISLLSVDKSQLSADNLYDLEIEIYYKNVSLVYTIASIIAIFIFFLIYKRFKVNALAAISFAKVKFGVLALVFAAGVLLNVFSVSFVEEMNNIIPQSWIDANQESVESFQQGSLIFQFLTVMVFAPIVEELLFRGILYTSLKNAAKQFCKNADTNKIVIIVSSVITSFLFGFIHGNILQGIYTFILSFVMIYAVEKTKSLIASIVIHMGFNMSALFTFFLYGNVSYLVLCIVSIILSIGAMILMTLIVDKGADQQVISCENKREDVNER